jgi:hypothetical protein
VKRQPMTRTRAASLLVIGALAVPAFLAGSGAAMSSSYCGHGTQRVWTLIGPHDSQYRYGWTSGGVHYHRYHHLVWYAVVHKRTNVCGQVPH